MLIEEVFGIFCGLALIEMLIGDGAHLNIDLLFSSPIILRPEVLIKWNLYFPI